MLLINSLCNKVHAILFGNPKRKTASKKRTRTLRIEELEPREMLSAAPMDWDWDEWWGNFSSPSAQVDPLPAGYHIDTNSEDFGKISLGGNASPIDATSAFIPEVISTLTAYDSVTRQGNTTLPNGNNPLTGDNTETITVGILSEDLGGGDWTYTEGASYSYSLPDGDNLYWSGYSYYLSASFTEGIYNSTFFLTTDYGGTVGFSAESTANDATLFWTTTSNYSVIDTVTMTHFHNTLTSERYSTDTRTTQGNGSYSESGTFSYSAAGGSVSETFGLSAASIAYLHSTISLSDTADGWVITSGSGHDSFNDSYNYSDNYLAAVSGENFNYTAHDTNRSDSLAVTTVDYIWSNGSWEIMGTATVNDSSGYDWGMILTADHDTGSISITEDSSHDESAVTHWSYDDAAEDWIAASVSGSGNGTYAYSYIGTAAVPYARPFYDNTITGTAEASIDHQRDESWVVSFRIVNGQVVRETDGSYMETYDTESSFSGGGGYSTNQTDTTPGTIDSYMGTATNHHEQGATFSESGGQTYFATITGEWEHIADNQGELSWQESADATITITSRGTYSNLSSLLTTSNFDGSYSNSNACSYSNGSYHAETESEQTSNASEEYESEIIETWHSDGGDFALLSLVSIASGSGSNHIQHSSLNNWRKTSSRGSSGYGCGCGYSEYDEEIGLTFTESFDNDDYDYTANWNWNPLDGATVDVDDHVAGHTGGTSTDSWHHQWTYSNGCVGSMGYDDVTPLPSSDYDETLPSTASGDDIDAAIEGLTTKRLQGLANLGAGLEATANFINSCTLPGSAYEFLWGKNASDEQLGLVQRTLSGASAGASVFAFVSKFLGKADDAFVKLAAQEALEDGAINTIKIMRPPRHHLFPVAHRQWFKDRGIDIDKYTIQLEQGVHEAIHHPKWEGNWNRELMKRLTNAEDKVGGRQLTVREIWDIMDGLRRKYKLPGDIVPYR